MRKERLEDILDERTRMGRLNEEDERFLRKLLLSGSRTSVRSPDRYRTGLSPAATLSALRNRARAVESGWSWGTGPQVVVKSATTYKTRKGIAAGIRYIGRRRDRDAIKGTEQVPLRDEFGSEVKSLNVQALMDDWHILPDKDNLSRQARELMANGRAMEVQTLPVRQKLYHVQGWHFVWSIPSDDLERDLGRIQLAYRMSIDELFAERGYRLLWAVHTDKPGKPHVHLIVTAVSRFGERIRCPRSGVLFDVMRDTLARNLVKVGFAFQATRRADRPQLRLQIAKGEVPLGGSRSAVVARRGPGTLQHRTPLWWGKYGREAQKREERLAPYLNRPIQSLTRERVEQALKPGSFRFSRPKPSREANIPEPYHPLYRELRSAFHDPLHALDKFLLMAMEGCHRGNKGKNHYPNQAMAIWTLTNRPHLFGEITFEALVSAWKQRARKSARALTLPHPNRYPYHLMAGAHHLWIRDTHNRQVATDRKGIALCLENLARYHEQEGMILGNSENIRQEIIRTLATKITATSYDNGHSILGSKTIRASDTEIQKTKISKKERSRHKLSRS